MFFAGARSVGSLLLPKVFTFVETCFASFVFVVFVFIIISKFIYTNIEGNSVLEVLSRFRVASPA